MQQPQDAQLSIFRSYASSKELTTVWRYFLGIYFSEITTFDQDFIKHCIQILAAKLISSGEGYMFCHYSFEAKSKIVSNEVVKVFTTTKRRSTANLPLIHFGNPRSAHDCAAILYLIAKIEQKSSVDINFRNCCLRNKQLGELATELARKQHLLQLKALDLSENQLSDEVVIYFFNEASTTFESIEKILLRDCHIGKVGMDVIITTIMLKCKNLRVLDLSKNNNSVSLHGIETGITSSDALSNLEVMLLQGCIIEEDITSLASFSDALTSSCKSLQRLDLSANNFGDAGDPALNGIISQLTSICEKFDLILDRHYMSEVEKNFIQIMEKSITEKGMIDHTVAHGVIVGPGRSGKNSLMNRLLGKGPPLSGFQSCSTGVLENVRKVEVKKLCTVSAAVCSGGLQWNELEYDEEAIELMMTTARSHSANSIVFEEDSDERPTGNSTEATTSMNEFAKAAASKRVKLVKHVKGSSTRYSKCKKQRNKNLFVYSSNVGRMDIFKQALRLRQMDGLRAQLESSWSLYLTNSGGQIEFQELLPLLISGPSVFFITFPLNKDLKKHYTVQFQHKDGSIEAYPSPSTLLDEILQTLATISALNSEHLECQSAKCSEYITNLKPKVFFVGTHKDELSKSSKDPEQVIEDIDSTLQRSIKKTSLYCQGCVEYACPMKRLIFTVDNLAEDDNDFQNIREALQLTVERSKDFTIQCPSTWLVFSLVLRANHKSNKILTYNECFKIAQSCGISDCAELNKALFFIHTRLGLLRYFSVDGLNSLVILDPQVLFDKITNLIFNTFDQKRATVNEIEEFQNRGILSVATIKRLSQTSDSESQIPLDWLLKLLNYLRIAAYFKDHTGDKYFFPSVVCRARKQCAPSQSSSAFNLHPPLLVAFKAGFCPRGIPGALIKYLMTNEMNSQFKWKLHVDRISMNQVTFAIQTLSDIVFKIHPTHLEIHFDPQCEPVDLNSTCSEAFTQIKRGMKAVTNEQNYYFFAFYCTRLECKGSLHPAEIEWFGNKPCKLNCQRMQRKGNLPEGYQVWMKPVEQSNGTCIMFKVSL